MRKGNATITDFVKHYDDFVKDWLGNREGKLKRQIFYKCMPNENQTTNDKGETVDILVANGVPEPYFGDPENCSALIININPGGVIPANNYEMLGTEGNIIQKYLRDNPENPDHNYSFLAKKFPYLGKADQKEKDKIKRTKETKRALDWWNFLRC